MLGDMWALFSARLRTWVLFTIAVPLAGALARAIARRIEARSGETKVSRSLWKVGNLARRREVSEPAPKRRGVAALRRR